MLSRGEAGGDFPRDCTIAASTSTAGGTAGGVASLGRGDSSESSLSSARGGGGTARLAAPPPEPTSPAAPALSSTHASSATVRLCVVGRCTQPGGRAGNRDRNTPASVTNKAAAVESPSLAPPLLPRPAAPAPAPDPEPTPAPLYGAATTSQSPNPTSTLEPLGEGTALGGPSPDTDARREDGFEKAEDDRREPVRRMRGGRPRAAPLAPPPAPSMDPAPPFAPASLGR